MSTFCLGSAGTLRNTQATLVWRTRELHATWTACYRRSSSPTSYGGYVCIGGDFNRKCTCPRVEGCFTGNDQALVLIILSLPRRSTWCLQREMTPARAFPWRCRGFSTNCSTATNLLVPRSSPSPSGRFSCCCWLFGCPLCKCVPRWRKSVGLKPLFKVFNG